MARGGRRARRGAVRVLLVMRARQVTLIADKLMYRLYKMTATDASAGDFYFLASNTVAF